MYNSKHLRTGSEEPSLNPDKLTVFNMRFCPYAERVVLVAIAKKIE